MISTETLNDAIHQNIHAALREDIGALDITAQLIPQTQYAHARIITREPMILAGRPWVDALFAALDPTVEVIWLAAEGAQLQANDAIFELKGAARSC